MRVLCDNSSDDDDDDDDDIDVAGDDGDGENSMPVSVDRASAPNTNAPLVAGYTVSAGAVGGAKKNAELGFTTDRAGRDS